MQLDEDGTQEMTRIMTMMMTTTMMDLLVVVGGELRGEEVEGLVRGGHEVEVEVRMQVGRGGLVMVRPLILPCDRAHGR